MRKRVPIVVGGGVALLLASQFLNFGLGWRSGSDRGGDSDPSAQVSVSQSQSFSGAPTAAPESNETTSDESESRDESESSDAIMRQAIAELDAVAAEPTPPDVVDVLIDGNQYLVLTRDGETQRHAMSLDQIVAYASTAAGEASGIRVRIARKPSAVAAAENAVIRRLTQAGLDADEIDSRRQLIE